jgi:hypothetical protein
MHKNIEKVRWSNRAGSTKNEPSEENGINVAAVLSAR